MRGVVLGTLIASAGAASSDLTRARQKALGAHVVGDGHVGMTVKLNAALRTMSGATLKACDEFSVEDLIQLQRKLHHMRDPAFEEIYRQSGDLGRRLGAFGKYADDLQELEKIWVEEMNTLKEYPQLADASRDRKCHEAIMWMVHHVPEVVQKELRKQVTLPLLPERELHSTDGAPNSVFPGGLGCDSAHAKQTTAKNTEYVEWPEELTYTATGHGAFPFWDNGGPGCSNCDPSVSNSAQIKTKYSSKIGSEIIMHESCGDMTWTGSSSAPNKSPCNHIFTPDLGAFIYTPKTSLEPEADGAFCCRTVNAGSTTFTGAVPRDWMKQGTYAGTYANFKGDHYSGEIKMFTWSQGGLQFWYYAKPDGTPVQQGEGCQQPGGSKPTACASMLPIVLYHDFNVVTNATYATSDFVVPDVCKTTSLSCTIPGASSEIIV